MKRSAAAALILMVLLFGGAYLTAREPDELTPETPQAQGDGAVVLTIKTGEAAERMTLRDYLVGVVRGEMPASFEMEALKAQAVAAVKAMPGAAAMSMRVRPLPRRKYITTRARAVPKGPEKM